MRASRILLIAALASFAVGIILSILFNGFFLFLFLPFGIGWGFTRRSSPKDRRGESEENRDNEEENSRTMKSG
jgi:hypothetical protein